MSSGSCPVPCSSHNPCKVSASIYVEKGAGILKVVRREFSFPWRWIFMPMTVLIISWWRCSHVLWAHSLSWFLGSINSGGCGSSVWWSCLNQPLSPIPKNMTAFVQWEKPGWLEEKICQKIWGINPFVWAICSLSHSLPFLFFNSHYFKYHVEIWASLPCCRDNFSQATG